MNIIKNVAFACCLAIAAITTAQALPANGTSVNPSQINLRAAGNSSVQWSSPVISTHKVWVKVPTDATASNAVYRIYLKGNAVGSNACSSTDTTYPCFEVAVNQPANQGKWVQLVLGTTSQWKFGRGGFVSVNANNVGTTEQLGVATLSFEDMGLKIGKKYQGGIIFYIDNTGQHGLIAAPSDQSAGAPWFDAVSLCNNLVIGKYADWRLPSPNELNLMYFNIGPGATAPLTNVGGFASIIGGAERFYWSSVQGSDYNFGTGNPSGDGPYAYIYVRAIRSF